MTNEMLLPILPRLDKAGYKAIEILDPFVFEACVMRLREDPWERLRLAAKRLARTRATVSIAGRYLFGCRPLDDESLRDAIRLLVRNGVTRLDVYDPLNDVQTLEPIVQEAKNLGIPVSCGIVHVLGTSYGADYFASKAQGLAKLGCDSIALLDFSGTLHPERVRELIPALHAAVGDIDLELRTHRRSGRAEIACFASLALGVTTIHTASEPLSGGTSVPSAGFFAEHLEREGYRSTLRHESVAAVADYFDALSDYHRLPRGTTLLPDVAVDRHQLPAELEQRFTSQAAFTDELLRIYDDLGNPPVAMPIAAWICDAATENLETGVRHRLRLTDFSQPAENASRRPRSEDEVTSLHFPADVLRDFLDAREAVDRSGWDVYADTPVQQLLAELERRPWIRTVSIGSTA